MPSPGLNRHSFRLSARCKVSSALHPERTPSASITRTRTACAVITGGEITTARAVSNPAGHAPSWRNRLTLIHPKPKQYMATAKAT